MFFSFRTHFLLLHVFNQEIIHMLHDIEPGIFKNTFFEIDIIQENDYCLCYKDHQIGLTLKGHEFDLPRKKDLKGMFNEQKAIYLFALNGTHCFLVPDVEKYNPQLIFKEVFELRLLKNKEIAWLGSLGHHLYIWYQANRYCGKCGAKTKMKKDERAILCPDCGNVVYPKISPAIIVSVTCENKILLARAVNFRSHFYSLIAGYTEAGESLEQTVAREVKEETGIDIYNIRYYKSQPWPFSGSIMIGFQAMADDKQPINIDTKEIVDAGWFTRGNLPVHPDNNSIAGEMIELFEKKDGE